MLRDTIRARRIEIAILTALFVGVVIFMIWWNVTEPMRERAAYLEGRLDLDHATAMRMAESEVL